jgi:hypothetical protein
MPLDGSRLIRLETLNGSDHFIIKNADDLIIKEYWEKIGSSKPTGRPPKHTGGKKPFIKIMLQEIEKHSDLSLSASGFFIKISKNIQWGDNLIINKRTKKALSVDDMTTLLKVSKPSTYKIIEELKKEKLIFKDNEGYKLSTDLIQKGGKKK